MNRRSLTVFLLAAAGLCGSPTLALSEPDNRIVVKTADDLPRHTYEIKGTSLELLKDDKAFFTLLDAIVADINADLLKYKLEDATTLRAAYDLLSTAATLKGNNAEALKYTAKARDLETKESEKLMRGITLQARIAGQAAAATDKAKFTPAFQAELRKLVTPLPFAVIKDRLIGVRNTAKMATRELVEGQLATSLDPIIAANKGVLSRELAAGLVTTRFTLEIALPLLPAMAEVYGEIIDANAKTAAAADLWAPRLITLPTSAPGTPVSVGIWDTGVDTSLFAGNLWTNPGEQANGRDDDGNGFIDDINGIRFGMDHKPATGPLVPLDGLKGDKKQLMKFVAASQDMQAGVESPGVEALRAHVKGLSPEALKTFSEDTSLLGNYAHGTHVAGIAAAGNPFARLVHVTETFDYKSIPDSPPTIEEYHQWGISAQQAAAYFKKSNARIVNMSWRIGRPAVEQLLAVKGAGGNEAERADLARRIFAELRSGLEAAIKNSPDILFIAGAGNEDNDLDFSEYIPAGLRLPNLITVGAVDDADKPASFTSFGKNVELYSNGYRIESVIPGGEKIKFSGTSMAAPQVSNLAAKILALKPELKPAEVVALIRANSDPLPNQPGRLIINPRKTIASLGVLK